MKTIAHYFVVIVVIASLVLTPSSQSREITNRSSSKEYSAPVVEEMNEAAQIEQQNSLMGRSAFATDTATPEAIPTDVAVTTKLENSPYSISLSSSPSFLTNGGKIKLDWIIEDQSNAANNKFVLQIVFPEGFQPDLRPNDNGTFDNVTRTLSIPAPDLKGSVHAQADNVSMDVLFSANLLNGQEAVASTTLLLPYKYEFELGMAGGELSWRNGKIKVRFPQDALSEAVTVDFGLPTQEAAPKTSLSGQAFELKAHSRGNGTEINKFEKEIEIEVQYEDYTAISAGDENELKLWWYNPETDEWISLPTEVDIKTKTLRAKTTHFTVFDVDFDSWNGSYTPTTDDFQVSEFTGAGAYSLPIEVPAGPGGLQPSLSLSYNSQVIDQSFLNATSPTQASWVGMGWSLDTGSIEMDYRGHPNNSAFLSVNGVSSRILRIQGNDDPNGITYQLAEENGWKISLVNKVGTNW